MNCFHYLFSWFSFFRFIVMQLPLHSRERLNWHIFFLFLLFVSQYFLLSCSKQMQSSWWRKKIRSIKIKKYIKLTNFTSFSWHFRILFYHPCHSMRKSKCNWLRLFSWGIRMNNGKNDINNINLIRRLKGNSFF